jgi:LuxR family maltose regulon positive regulatory protein
LTLVSAPAGFGKTTLVSCWLAQQERPVAWVSLDKNDNDSVRFFSYIILALQQVVPNISATALQMLQSREPPSPEVLMIDLINDLIRLEQDCFLVLDDYHLIHTQTLHSSLTFLLDNLPPQLHIVIVSRVEPPLPIAKLRAKNHMVELHASDLRFTRAEVKAFLNRVMKLNLSVEEITNLETRTEGWAVGLQLAALSLKDKTETTQFISNLSGNDRFIADYLVDEVLSHQSKDIQRFLLGTSILRQMSAPLCDAVIGIENSQEILEYLEISNLFIIPLDNKRGWYRYHHLFAELLRSRLERERQQLIPKFFQQAILWHQGAGLLEEAIDYALEIKDYKQAATLLERIVARTLSKGGSEKLFAWLSALPDELLQEKSTLWIYFILVHIDFGRFGAATKILNRLWPERETTRQISEIKWQTIRGHKKALLAAINTHNSVDASGVHQLAEEALTLLPKEEHLTRAIASAHNGWARRQAGDLPAAKHALEMAMRSSEVAGSTVVYLVSFSNWAELIATKGRLQQAKALFQEAYQYAHHHGLQKGNTFSNAVIGLGSLYYEWNDLVTAEKYLREGISLAESGAFLDRLLLGYSALIHLQITQQDIEGAQHTLRKIARAARKYGNPRFVIKRLAAMEANMALAQEDVQKALDWVVVSGLENHNDVNCRHEYEWRTLAGIRLAKGDTEESIALLAKMLSLAQNQGRLRSAVKIETGLAKAYYIAGELSQALVELEKALELAEPEGYIRTFLDGGEPVRRLLEHTLIRLVNRKPNEEHPKITAGYIRKLLTALDPTRQLPTTPRAPVSLTPRELEVLHLIAAGLSYSDMTHELTITENTLKTHVKHIYDKLNVRNRMQAVLKAKEFSLLQ